MLLYSFRVRPEENNLHCILTIAKLSSSSHCQLLWRFQRLMKQKLMVAKTKTKQNCTIEQHTATPGPSVPFQAVRILHQYLGHFAEKIGEHLLSLFEQ